MVAKSRHGISRVGAERKWKSGRRTLREPELKLKGNKKDSKRQES